MRRSRIQHELAGEVGEVFNLAGECGVDPDRVICEHLELSEQGLRIEVIPRIRKGRCARRARGLFAKPEQFSLNLWNPVSEAAKAPNTCDGPVTPIPERCRCVGSEDRETLCNAFQSPGSRVLSSFEHPGRAKNTP